MRAGCGKIIPLLPYTTNTILQAGDGSSTRAEPAWQKQADSGDEREADRRSGQELRYQRGYRQDDRLATTKFTVLQHSRRFRATSPPPPPPRGKYPVWIQQEKYGSDQGTGTSAKRARSRPDTKAKSWTAPIVTSSTPVENGLVTAVDVAPA